jgi:hypothetical protein
VRSFRRARSSQVADESRFDSYIVPLNSGRPVARAKTRFQAPRFATIIT